MKDFPLQAKMYLLANFVAAALILYPVFSGFEYENILLTLVICIMTSLTQIFKVEGSTDKSSYNVSWIFYGFSLVLLGVPQTIIIILISHIVEWVWYRYPWVIQTFNIASHIIVTAASGLILASLKAAFPTPEIIEIAWVLVSLALFTFLNHLSIGLVIRFARGQGLRESGVLSGLSLMLDFALLCLGAASAYVWRINPLATILNIIPLYLIYNTLKVPALQRKTDLDPKTGLFNSSFFSDSVEKELARSNRFNRPVTVVMADMDLLRNINNTYGHLAGDDVIIGIARILKSSFREYDIVARFGGEEFAILMPETILNEALPRIEEVRRKIEKSAFKISTHIEPIKVTMSFGVAEREGYDQNKDQLLHNADKALYQAKLSGRNQVSVHRNGAGKVKIELPTHIDQSRAQVDLKSEGEIIQGIDNVSVAEAGVEHLCDAIETSKPKPHKVNTHPHRRVRWYIGILTFLATMYFLLLVRAEFHVDWYGLMIFTVLAIFAESLSIDIYVKDSSVSTSAVPFIAGVYLFGPVGAVVIGVGIALSSGLKNRRPIHRTIFNISNQAIGGLLCSSVLLIAGDQLPIHQSELLQFAFALIFGGLLFLSTTVLLSLAIGLDKSVNVQEVWRQNFQWLGPIYLAMGALGYALVHSFQNLRMLGVVAIIAPLMVLRLSQHQYLLRTKALVKALKSTNKDLTESTQESKVLNAELLEALAEVVDLRDPTVLGHSRNVAEIAKRLVQELRLSSGEVDEIYKAGLPHDLGKVGIPEAIHQKSGKFTDEEDEIVKKHPDIAAQVVENTIH